MRTKRRTMLAAGLMTLSMMLCVGFGGAAQPEKTQPEKKEKGKGLKAKSWNDVADAAVTYLKTTQADDGSWSKTTHPGITAVVLTGLFKSGKATADDPMAAKGLMFVETLINAKEGHLAGGDDLRHKNYITSVNLIALKSSGAKKYEAAIGAATGYLKKGQVGADDMKKADDINFGGFGYGPGTRADVSNTHFALDALTAAGIPKDDPVYKNAVVFISRAQNLKSEFNTQPWAGRINDGSFIYVLPQPGATGNPDDPRPGYGSMTYAGLKCLHLGGVGKDDPRYKKALEWVGKNYSVDLNPGRAEGSGGQGYFYYLVSMARCLDTLGLDEVTDANGKVHNWREEITRALANRQRKDGSWGNDFQTWMEGEPNLDTGYALIALGYTRPKAK